MVVFTEGRVGHRYWSIILTTDTGGTKTKHKSREVMSEKKGERARADWDKSTGRVERKVASGAQSGLKKEWRTKRDELTKGRTDETG